MFIVWCIALTNRHINCLNITKIIAHAITFLKAKSNIGMARRWLAIHSPGQCVSLVNYLVQLTSYPETIEEEGSEGGSPDEEGPVSQTPPGGRPGDTGLESPHSDGEEQPPAEGAVVAPAPKPEDKDAAEIQKRRRLEQAGIKVMPAAQRFARLALPAEGWPGWLSACRQFGICLASWTLHLVFLLPALPSAPLFPTLNK